MQVQTAPKAFIKEIWLKSCLIDMNVKYWVPVLIRYIREINQTSTFSLYCAFVTVLKSNFFIFVLQRVSQPLSISLAGSAALLHQT